MACLPPQQDCYLLSAMHVMPFRPCPKHCKMVKAENRARPAVTCFLLNKAPRSGKKHVFLGKVRGGFFFMFATSLKDRLARWLVMASDLGPNLEI